MGNRNQPSPTACAGVVQQNDKDDDCDHEPQASEKRKAKASAILERTRQMALESGKHGDLSSEEEDDEVDIDDDQLFSTTLMSYSSLAGQDDGECLFLFTECLDQISWRSDVSFVRCIDRDRRLRQGKETDRQTSRMRLLHA